MNFLKTHKCDLGFPESRGMNKGTSFSRHHPFRLIPDADFVVCVLQLVSKIFLV